MFISIFLMVVFFILLAFAPTYIKVSADFTNYEMSLARVPLYRAVLMVYWSVTGRADAYIRFTRLSSWSYKGE